MIVYPNLSQLFALYDEVTRVSGGAYGLRDLGYLESALHQSQQTFGGNDLYPTLHEKAAALGYALIMDHPFVDGNKRIGLAAIEFFLELNGFTLDVNADNAVDTILGIAKGEMPRKELAEWIQIHIAPFDISE